MSPLNATELVQVAVTGMVQAQRAVGAMYENGEGVTQHFESAMAWCRKAAEQGNTTARARIKAMNAVTE